MDIHYMLDIINALNILKFSMLKVFIHQPNPTPSQSTHPLIVHTNPAHTPLF